ncbi:MAG: hypothetical protein Q9225_001190 [Loekoesia sp. 1 TL-2023]
MEPQPSSPATPTVQGFTPINQCPDPTIPPETLPTTAPPGIRVDNGKKRQRKLSEQASTTSKPTKGNRPRQPKKAKQGSISQSQDTFKTFKVTKPHTQGNHVQSEPLRTSSLATVRETSTSGLESQGISLSEKVDDEFSPATYRMMPSSTTNGLGSVYQAAFKLEEKPSIPVEISGLLHPLDLTSTDTVGKHSLSAVQPVSLSASMRTTQLNPGEAVPLTGRLASEGEGVSSQAVGVPVCQVPCSSGVLLNGQHAESGDVELQSVTASFPSVDQCIPEVNSADWNWDAAHPDISFEDLNDQNGEPSPPHMEDCNLHVPDFHDLLLAAAGNDCSPMDIDEAELSMLMSEFINCQDDILGDTIDFSSAAFDTSSSSDVDTFQSLDDNDIIDLSSDTTFIESTSPYLQSRSDLPRSPNQNDKSSKLYIFDQQCTCDDTYSDEDLEAGLVEFQSPPSAQIPRQSPTTTPLNPAVSSTQNTVSPTPKSKKETSNPQDIPHKVSFDRTGTPIPFIRTPFPAPIRDRSPVIGLSSSTLLRTCFRIGEALNAGSIALRTRQDAVIELYARVLHSERPVGSVKQHFQFADIFMPDKPPFLKGTYGLWKGSELWNLDSKVFLGEKGKGKMARMVGRMGRDEKTRSLEMTVLSVFEVGWEDVGIVKGIVCG